MAAKVATTLTTSDGATVHGAYLAIVADDRPWSEPLLETTAAGAVTTWDVPAGTWRIIAIAPQLATTFSEPFTLAPSDDRAINLRLPSLQRVAGYVVDQSGHPIQGASVTHSVAAPLKLSALAREHSRTNASATTSANGAFVLFVPSPSDATLLVEARGHAPVLAAAAPFSGGHDNKVSLEKGASLTVRWNVQDARPGSLSLVPVDVSLSKAFTRDTAVAIWTRPIAGGEARWDSLPAGTYRLLSRAGTAASDAAVPAEIREFVLAATDAAVVELSLPSAQSPDSQTKPATVRILLEETAADIGELSASEWHNGTRRALSVATQQVSGGVLVTTRAQCALGNTLLIESQAAIATTVLDGACGDTLRVRLAPRGDVAAHISVPRTVRMPSSGTLHQSKCAGGDSIVKIPFTFSGSRMRSAAIAGCGAMSLHASGFAPVNLPPPALKVGEVRDLGAITLTPGAAVALRVRAARDLELQPGVRVSAVRAHELATLRGNPDLQRIAITSTFTDAAGWARLSGLPEEKVVLLFQAPTRTYPQLSEPYALRAGEETILDDALLEVPSNVFVTVVLPDELKESVQLSTVELAPVGHSHWPTNAPIRGDVTQSAAAIEDVPPGKWSVRAAGRLRNGFALYAAAEEIDVVSGVDRHVTLTITDRLFHGRVTHRDAPVVGIINLKPAGSTKGRHAVANLDADGRFVVLLENPGDYHVFVQQKKDGSATTVAEIVAFEDSDSEISIELATGRIRGRVVDSTGAPVQGVLAGAKQQVGDTEAQVGARVGADGQFVIDYVSPGRWDVAAVSKNAKSEPVMVVADHNGDVDGVTLVLDPIAVVQVRLVDITGAPVHDISVTVEFPSLDPTKPEFQGSLTRQDGTVDLRVTPRQQTTPSSLVVLSSRGDRRLFCALRKLDSDQTVTMPAQTGDLRLIARRWTGNVNDRGWLVAPDGCAVGFHADRERESDGNETMVFRGLAAGRWIYVRTRNPNQLAAVLTGRGANLPAIQTFIVEAGRTTRVSVPSP